MIVCAVMEAKDLQSRQRGNNLLHTQAMCVVGYSGRCGDLVPVV